MLKNSHSRSCKSAIFILLLTFCQSFIVSADSACSIKRFAEVASGLYRGAQPKHEDYAKLRSMGIRTVVSFRKDPSVNRERQWAEQEGIRFISIPWESRDEYSPKRNLEFLRIAQDPQNRPLFVHCRVGRDRTGFMIAAFRIAVDGWSEQDALREMKSFGYSDLFYPNLRLNLHRFATEYSKEMKYGLLDQIYFAILWIKELPIKIFTSVLEISPLRD